MEAAEYNQALLNLWESAAQHMVKFDASNYHFYAHL
jgi:hypothetical protein